MTAEQFTGIYMEWRNREIERGVDQNILTMAHFAADVCTQQDETLERIRTWLYNAAQESPIIHSPSMSVFGKVH